MNGFPNSGLMSDTMIAMEMISSTPQFRIDNSGPMSEAIQPCSIDVRLGMAIKRQIRTGRPVGPGNPPTFRDMGEAPGMAAALFPGEFYLASTMERFTLGPSIAMCIEGKSTLGRMGLEVHSTAGWIDPGFSGELTLEMKVVGVDPVWVIPGMYIAQVCVFQLDVGSTRPYGDHSRTSHYQNQSGPTEPAN